MDHRPPHLLINECWYFITAHTLGKTPIFVTNQHKDIWKDVFTHLLESYKVQSGAWVLLDDHYHLLCYFDDGSKIPKFLQQLHGVTAIQLNRLDQVQGRSVWYSYWDRYIRDDHDYWQRFNYIHFNPVKHEYVIKPEDWLYSSYFQNLLLIVESKMEENFIKYPVFDSDFDAYE